MDDDRLVHVVEDDPAMRDALLLLLGSADLAPRGHDSAERFFAALSGARPVCVLSDLRLPGMDGMALLRHLLAARAGSAVIMITGHGDVPLAVAALKAGASDFVEKPFDPGLLLDSVFDARARVSQSRRRQTDATGMADRLRTLTAREREVFDLLVEGHPNKTVAAMLGISVRTAEHHRARVMEKMQARAFSGLIKAALGRPD